MKEADGGKRAEGQRKRQREGDKDGKRIGAERVKERYKGGEIMRGTKKEGERGIENEAAGQRKRQSERGTKTQKEVEQGDRERGTKKERDKGREIMRD